MDNCRFQLKRRLDRFSISFEPASLLGELDWLPALERPAEAKERIRLERETFLTAVRRVSLLAGEKSVKLIFTKGNIDIVANTPEVGEAKESLPVMYQGREYSIAFNPEFLMAPLRNLSEEEIYLDLIDELSPGVIKIAGPFLYVLMPVRL